MNILTLILIILIAAIVILQLIIAVHYLGIYPFTRDSKKTIREFIRLYPRNDNEKKETHCYQTLSGWNDRLEDSWVKSLSGTNDPAVVLEKAIGEFQRDPGEKNRMLMVRLSNHISNRIRYDENIDGLIEKISELIKKS